MSDEPIEQTEPSAPAAEAPAAPATGSAPWSKDIEAMGLGTHGDVVDGYLRETIQPRITKLEQDLAEYREMFPTKESAEVAAAIAHGLANPDTYKETLGYLKDELEWTDVEIAAAEQVAERVVEESQEPQYAQLPPEYQAFLEQQMQERETAEHNRVLDEFYSDKAKEFGEDFDSDLYKALFVSMTVSDKDVPIEIIDGRYQEMKAKMTPPPPPAPQVLTGGTTAPSGGDGAMTLEDADQALRDAFAAAAQRSV